MVAMAPAAAPCSRRFSDSRCSIEGTGMVFPFARHVRSETTDTPMGSGLAGLHEDRTLCDGYRLGLRLRLRPSRI
jgi:hypothetical protein